MTTIRQQTESIWKTINAAKRITLVAPNPVQGTRRERLALAGIKRRHPDAQLFMPGGHLVTVEQHETRYEPVVVGQLPEFGDNWEAVNQVPAGERIVKRRVGGESWGHILETAGVVYVLTNPGGHIRLAPGQGTLGGTIGIGCVANIEQANRHGAIIRIITSVEPFACLTSPLSDLVILRDSRGMFPAFNTPELAGQLGDCLIVWDQSAAEAWGVMGRRFFPSGLTVGGEPVTLSQVNAMADAEYRRQLAGPSMN